MTVSALAGLSLVYWGFGRRGQAGRHLRSPLGPVRSDGSGWTEEALAGDFPEQPRGPEDDPEFVARMARLLRRPRPGSEA